MKIAVIGTGYVGLISGVCLANVGHHVACVDLNKTIVETLNSAVPTIYEEGLQELLEEVVHSGHFVVTEKIEMALENAELVLVAVGTPSANGAIDLSFIGAACRSIGQFIKGCDSFISVVIKSTVTPGTTDTFVKESLEKASGKKLGEFGLGMNPEFLREGKAIDDFSKPDRIVLGYEDPKTLNLLQELYRSWECEKLSMNSRSAEMVKYANNALLATQISTINELANLSSSLGGVNFDCVCRGVHLDKRWSPILDSQERIYPDILSYLVPGCGFGGSCFPKDVQALRSQGQALGQDMRVLNAVLDVNYQQPYQVSSILKKKLGVLLGKEILVLGLSFKPGTDDVRESPALKIIPDLLSQGASLVAHDPVAAAVFKECLGSDSESVLFTDNWIKAVIAAEVIVLVTAWDEYLELSDLDISHKTVFDCRDLFKNQFLTVDNYLKFGNT